ncbi:unnamed protein product [Trichobilharzia szidati]|nr:unnamed protein product [Trichobilharzia szidati]
MVTEKNWETNMPGSESTEHQANYGSNTTVNSLDACLDSIASKTDGASDSDFDERDVSAEDDDSIPPEEDAADEEEVSSLMKESQMSLDELLATYGISSNTNIRSINTPASKGRPARLKGGRRTATPPTINTSTQEPLESIPPTKKPRRTATTSSVDTENTDPQTTRSVQRNRPTSIDHAITYSSSSDVEGLIEKKSDDSPLCCLTSFTHPHSVPCSHSASPVSIDISFSDPSSTAPTPKHSRRPPVDNPSRISRGHSLRSRAKSNSTSQNSAGLLDNTIPSNTPLDKQSEKEEMETVLSDSDSGDIAEKECQESNDGKAVKVEDGNDEGEEEEEAVAVTTEVEEGEGEDDTKCENNEDYSSRFWKNAITGQATPLSYNSDEDEDYCPSEDSGQDWKGEIKIGDDYQANVPVLLLSAPAPSSLDNRSICVSSISGSDFSGCAANARAERVFQQSSLVWRPVDKLSEADVIRYERLYAQIAMSSLPSDRTIDDEEALFLLMLCDYDVEEALQRQQLKAVQPTEVPGYLESWSEADCTAFEKSFALYGKDFRQIRDTRLRHKTVSEVIHFYYLWKKTARHDAFARIYRRDKKKSSHPNIT